MQVDTRGCAFQSEARRRGGQQEGPTSAVKNLLGFEGNQDASDNCVAITAFYHLRYLLF